jgi:hypothetical protein
LFAVQVKSYSFRVILEVAMGFEPSLWTDADKVDQINKWWEDYSKAMFALPINLPGTREWCTA